ncbi:hypothetical protein [Sinorhizobium medicae]|uniref:hypothetical protein n=1 Tax=Sinorhizobium medicae TaxID=110321 RepID=UPI000C7BAFDB|nr:hypothetical protein [Sinorhizobium medicae]MDX0512740.1 hypothetical protein [Sinorhizobium medicae]MDX0937380.1 hypothetical protein [Sinorhizobium medicae]MDX0943513.1 hypothetical protein [Sinorhizobium medicae]MDX0949011.1 hypothetical protein [Sinorhizobium medicae]MDX1010701.1 hypothetical protein [Sinorhizobium medicae]
MTVTLAICAHCQMPFTRKRKAQRACSSACKQALFRSEKCNAGIAVPAEREIEPGELLGRVSEVYARIYPGLKPLSDLECRVMKLRATDHRDKSGALLYETAIHEKGPADVGASPSRGSIPFQSKRIEK